MAQKTYCGIGNIARQVPDKGYGGDDNEIARKLIKGYCGDSDNIARQFWPSGEDTQNAMSFAASYAPGGIYELDVCYPIAAISYAIKEACKINKAYYKDRGVYSLIKQYVSTIITHFLSVKGDANVVRVYIDSSSYNNGNTYITVYYGKVDNLTREVSDVSTNIQYGIKYATLADSIYFANGFVYAFSHSNHTVRSYAASGGYISRMGLYVSTPGSTYGEALTIDVTNLGMVNYSISMIYDWYWNFNSLEQPMVDRVDGLIAFKNNTSSSDPSPDDCIYDKWDYINLPSFLWEKGRTIEVSLGEAERHYEKQDWGKSYPRGALLGIYNTAGYGSTPGIGFDVTPWDRYDTSKLRGRRNYGTVLGSELSTPNQLSGKLLTVYFDEDKITLTTNDGLSAYIDEAPSLVNRNYFRIGCVVPVSLGYEALYKFKVRSVAIY